MKDTLDLFQEGFHEGDVVVIGLNTRNFKRVIFCKRLNCPALQNLGENDNGVFSNLSETEKGTLWGSTADTFTLPAHNKGKVRVVAHQPVVRKSQTAVEQGVATDPLQLRSQAHYASGGG